MKKLISVVSAILFLLCLPFPAFSHPAGFSPMPESKSPTSDPPKNVVEVNILDGKFSDSLDPDTLFIVDRPDIYGRVTIDGETFSLPVVSGDNTPHWSFPGNQFRKTFSSTTVPISIELFDEDTGSDTHIDISPVSGRRRLDLVFDTCSLRITGDIDATAQDFITVTGDISGEERGWLNFEVKMADRPNTTDDVALLDVDLIQVVPTERRIVAGKPTIVLARIASNYSTTVTTSLKLQIFVPGGVGTIADDTFSIVDLEPGEVRKEHFYVASPLVFPPATSGADEIIIFAQIDPERLLSKGLPPDDCRVTNDAVSSDPKSGLVRSIVNPEPLTIAWAKGGTFLDSTALVSDTNFSNIRRLGSYYIKSIYPANIINKTVDIPVIPPNTAAFDGITRLAEFLGIPTHALTPFVLLFEINVGSIWADLFGSDTDRVMVVVPENWFDGFSGYYGFWDTTPGVSLGPQLSYSVIFEATGENPLSLFENVNLELPAHELGHTFGLSDDPRLKSLVFCGSYDPISQLICAASGGYDEYTHEDPALTQGNPARGFWVRQTGGTPVELSGIVGTEQEDSHCFMGGSQAGSYTTWTTAPNLHHWVDADDYTKLLNQLTESASLPITTALSASMSDPINPPINSESIFVSGAIAENDELYLGSWYRLPFRKPDRVTGDHGYYAFRFVDEFENTLQEVGLPIRWLGEGSNRIPITFFAQTLTFPDGTKSIQIWNNATDTMLIERHVSPTPPEISVNLPKSGISVVKGKPLHVQWRSNDSDKDTLEHNILLSQTGKQWMPAPAGYLLPDLKEHCQSTEALLPGPYFLKVIAADGVNITESNIVSFNLASNNIVATVDIAPENLSIKSKGKYITGYIELPGEDVASIDTSSVLLACDIPAQPKFAEIADYDNDGEAELMVKFDREAVLLLLTPGTENLLTLSGRLIDGREFAGSDSVSVK